MQLACSNSVHRSASSPDLHARLRNAKAKFSAALDPTLASPSVALSAPKPLRPPPRTPSPHRLVDWGFFLAVVSPGLVSGGRARFSATRYLMMKMHRYCTFI